MKKNKQISTKQIRGIVVSTIVGVGIISLPQRLAIIMENDGWIGILLGGLLISLLIVVIDKIFKLYPGKSVYEIGKEVYGKWLFKIFLVLTLVYFIAFMGFLSRHLGEITKAFLLENTPIEVIIITFILVSTYISRCNIEIIGRASYHIYSLILGYVIVLILLSFKSIDLTNMLPLFQSDMKKIPQGVLTSFFSYAGFEILLFVIPFAEERDETLKASLSGLGIVTAIYLIAFVLSLSQVGVYHLKRQSFATLSIIKQIDLPGYFIENLDILVVGIWILIVFATMAPMYFMGTRALADLFDTKSHDLFVLPLVPLIYIVSLLPENMLQLNEILGEFINYMGLTIIVALPIITYTIGYYKVRRREK